MPYFDLILSSASIQDCMCTKVSDEMWGSDHLSIFVNVLLDNYIYHEKSSRIGSVRTNWPKVNVELENN